MILSHKVKNLIGVANEVCFKSCIFTKKSSLLLKQFFPQVQQFFLAHF